MKNNLRNIPKLRFPEFDGEWDELKIKNFTKTIAGGTPSTLKKEYWNGDIRWMNSGELNLKKVYDVQNRITQLGLNNSSSKLLPKNCVLIGLAGQGKTRGTIAINKIELCTNQSVASILPNEKFNPDFLYFNLDNRYEELRSLSAGEGGRGGLNLEIINNIKVPFPSLPEQTKITGFLTAVDEKIQALKKKKSLLETYKKGVMQKIFSQQLRFKDDDGNEFPDWEEKKLGEVYSFKSTNSYSRENLNYDNGLIKNIHYGDIHTKFKSQFDITKELVPFINPELSNNFSEDNFCKEGDLVIADASEDYTDVGKSIELVNLNREKIVAGLHTILARPDLSIIRIGFANFLMKSSTIRKQIMVIAQGIKVLSISATRFSEIEITCPSLPEQTKIANFLSAIDEKIARTGEQIDKMEKWKKGLLQKMFC